MFRADSILKYTINLLRLNIASIVNSLILYSIISSIKMIIICRNVVLVMDLLFVFYASSLEIISLASTLTLSLLLFSFDLDHLYLHSRHHYPHLQHDSIPHHKHSSLLTNSNCYHSHFHYYCYFHSYYPIHSYLTHHSNFNSHSYCLINYRSTHSFTLSNYYHL